MRTLRKLLLISAWLGWILLAGCGGDSSGQEAQTAPDAEQQQIRESTALPAEKDSPTEAEEPHPAYDEVIDIIAEPMVTLWKEWHGDLDGMVERRAIRVLVPFGGYQYYYDRGRPRGAIVELLQKMEQHLNKELGRRHIKVYVAAIPVSRDQLIPFLLGGHGDLAAADLTVTAERSELVQFSRPLLRGINEIVVTGPSSPPLKNLTDLSGQEVVVRESSSYFEHLQVLNKKFEQEGIPPVRIEKADELLEAEDLLELVNAGMIPTTILDDYKAEFWKTVFPDIVVREDLKINGNGVIAWAMPPQSTELAAYVERFLRKNGRGTLVGNDTYNRYLADASRVRCAMSPRETGETAEMVRWFRKYGEEYDYDWLMLAAQGYQESHLTQSKRSHVGAIGVMQIKPSTAADPKIGIDDVTNLQNNIHAGAKYMRFLSDRYFADGMDDRDRWMFSLAAYNAGPARVIKLRKEAAENGLDRNVWLGNVEIIAGRRIGRETVTYVSSIYKYYVGYRLSRARMVEERERHGAELTGCDKEAST